MGKQYSQTGKPLQNHQTMARKYCVGVGEEGGGGAKFVMVTRYKLIFDLNSFLSTASSHKDFEITILQDKRHYIRK